jgi:hypothetical protein
VLRQQGKETPTRTLPQPESAVQVLIVHGQEVGNRKGMLEAGFGEWQRLELRPPRVRSKGEDRIIQPPPFAQVPVGTLSRVISFCQWKYAFNT